MPKTQKDRAAMSVEELEARNQDLMLRKEAIREEQRAIALELDRRAAAARVAAMTDTERDALVHTIGVVGIPSAEQVGG